MTQPLKTCALCLKHITDRSYRSLSSPNSVETYKDAYYSLSIDTISGFGCNVCVNKLNRILKLNCDLKTKLAAIKCEQEKLICAVKSLPGFSKLSQSKGKSPKTPSPRGFKRSSGVIKTTPTPTSKLKKCLFSSPRPTRESPKTNSAKHRSEEKSTQTKLTTEPFDVKVTVNYAGQERSKIIRGENEKSALKAMLNQGSASTVIKNLCKDENYKKAALQFIENCVNVEIKEISRIDCQIFQGHASRNEQLINFTWNATSELIKTKTPFLHSILSNIVCVKGKQKLPLLITATAILLYGRNQKLSKLQYILGTILHSCGLTKEGLSLMHDLGICVSPTSVNKKRKQLVSQQENQIENVLTSHKIKVESSAEMQQKTDVVEQDAEITDNNALIADQENMEEAVLNKETVPIEILGDNLDITINPSKMSLDHQRKSLHWFLVMVKQKQITAKDSDTLFESPTEDFLKLDAAKWVLSDNQLLEILCNFKFHVASILIENIDFIHANVTSFPKYIHHKFIEKIRSKTVFLNCDLIDASENSAQGMIEIMQRIHKLAVPHVPNREGNDEKRKKDVLEKVVFGGDVLTNERAYTAQEAMQNCPTEYEALMGVIHRPEGLHRQMNFLLGMYQLFYKEQSAQDKGSLYQLRNLLNRRNVSGPDEVVSSYRSHHDFVKDTTDGYILAAFLDMMDMETLDSKPHTAPLLTLMTEEQKCEWLLSIAEQLLHMLKIDETLISSFKTVLKEIQSFDQDFSNINAMKVGDLYQCVMCGAHYRKEGWLKKHLLKKHGWEFHEQESTSSTAGDPLRTFLLMSLLYRDTCDSYKMGDGDRIVRNVYLEWLFAAGLKHTKYRLWLFRLLCNIFMLSPEESFEYKWNMTVNLQGGIRKSIPNDNLVEIQVHNIKSQLNTQGSNKSFQSAKQICMTTQVTDAIKRNLLKETKTVTSKGKRPEVNKKSDLETIIKCLRSKGLVTDLTWPSFTKFIDPISVLDMKDLHEWICHQRNVASIYLK